MALKFNGDLSTGDATQWSAGEIDGAGIGTITADAGDDFDSGYFYRIAATAAGEDNTYFQQSISSGGYEAFYGAFKFRISTINLTNSGRNLRILEVNGTGADEFTIALQTITGGTLQAIEIRHQSGSGVQILTTTLAAGAIQANTVHEIQFQYLRATAHTGSDGLIRVWLDGTLVCNHTGLATVATSTNSTLQFGLPTNTATAAFNLDVADFKLATNSDFTDTESVYYVDPYNGAETNDGTTAATAWRNMIQANNAAKAGDTVVLVGSALYPIRARSNGVIDTVNAGAVNNSITIRGNSADSHTPIIGTLSFPPSGWTGPDGNGEYSISVSSSTTADPKRIYVCTESDWQSNGIDAIDPRIVGLDSIRLADGTAGALTAGQAAYNAGTVYYKPQSGETFSALHIEIPCRTSGYGTCAQVDTNYTVMKWIDALFPVTSGIAATANGTGSRIIYCSGVSAVIAGIQNNGSACQIRECYGSWAINLGASSGDGILCNGAGTGSVIRNICHDNANDGIAFSSTHAAQCVGNLSINNGYAGTGNECGIEITGSAVIQAYHNTCVGNYSHGIMNQSDQAAGQDMANNIVAFNGTYGINVTAIHGSALMNYNASYGNGSFAFNIVGTGTVTPTGAVTTNPLFLSAGSTAGMSSTWIDGDYRLDGASPCREVTDDSAICERYWTTGARPECIDNPAPDRRACMGAYQQ